MSESDERPETAEPRGAEASDRDTTDRDQAADRDRPGDAPPEAPRRSRHAGSAGRPATGRRANGDGGAAAEPRPAGEELRRGD